jgi:hypothetical protein
MSPMDTKENNNQIHCHNTLAISPQITTCPLNNLRQGLVKPRGVTTATRPHRATSHRLFDGGFAAAQAERQFAQHARNKLLARKDVVAVLVSPGQYVGRQVHEGPTKAAAGLHCEGPKPGNAWRRYLGGRRWTACHLWATPVSAGTAGSCRHLAGDFLCSPFNAFNGEFWTLSYVDILYWRFACTSRRTARRALQ